MPVPAAIRWSAIIFLVALVGIQFLRPSMTNPPTPASASLMAKAPPNIGALLDRSCKDCHSNTTTWPWYSQITPINWMLATHVNAGRSRFNYSEWSSLSSDDQDKFLGAMCSMVKKRRMPLPSHLLIHRGSTLSDTDIATICAWSDTMRDTLK